MRPIPARRALGAAVVATGVLSALFALSFLGALHDPKPHGLPVAVVAPAPVRAALGAALRSRASGAFCLRGVSSSAAARAAVFDRSVDGAFIVGHGRAQVLVTAAGGQAVAQTITAAFAGAAAALHASVVVHDIVPLEFGDPLGLSSFFLVLSVVLPSVAAGAAVGLAARSVRLAERMVALVVSALVIGLVVAWITDGVLGALVGHALALAALAALLSLAVSSTTAGLASVAGPPGVAAASLVVVVLGLPASGGPVGLGLFLPSLFRVLRHALPPGAALEAVRGIQYFTGNGVVEPAWVLVAWGAGGLALLGAGRVVHRVAAV